MKLLLIFVSLLLAFNECKEDVKKSKDLIPASRGTIKPTPTSYCQPKLCEKGQMHVACKNYTSVIAKKEQKSSCLAKQVHLVDFSAFKDRVLKLHNERRYSLANGKNSQLPDAARMVTMQWSSELATVAGFNARMCSAMHDECHNTATFPHSGQNIFVSSMRRLVGKKDMTKLYPKLLANAIKAWWSQSANMTFADMKLYPCEVNKQRELRHFAVMAVEDNSHVGCAAVHYVFRNITQFKLTCNYARSPVCGQPIYHFGGCQTGRNPRHVALCSPEELFR